MGSIQYPRIYFTGYQYWNPNTVNNNDYGGAPPDGVNTWDPPKAKFDWDYLGQEGVNGFDEVPAFLRTNKPYDPDTRLMPPAEWGYYGGQECGFVNSDTPQIQNPDLFSHPTQPALTTGYTDASGNYDNAVTEPWMGQPIQLEPGKLVDVNPMSFWSSQVFASNFTLGGNGFSAPPVARMHSRFISTAKRNYDSTNDLVIAAEYGTVFQTCFEKSSVVFQGTSGPLQQQIEAAFAAGAEGLMLRYSAYATLYFQGDAFNGMAPGDRYPMLEKMGELYQQFSDGDLANPPISRAYSKVAGWVGLWMPGELASVPGGRFLIPYEPGQGAAPVAVTPSNLTAEQYQPPPTNLPPNTDGPIHAPQPLGPATIEVETDDSGNAVRFTLDLANTFPERDSTCLKADFGTVKLGLRASNNSIRWISEDVPYDQATYEQYGGLVDLPGAGITAAELIDGSFILQVESGQAGATSSVTALVETLATAQTDTRGMYADQPDPSFSDGNAPSPGPGMPSTSPTCEVQVRYQGFAPEDHPATVKPSLKLTWDALDYQLNPYSAGAIPIDVLYKNTLGQFVPFTGAIDVPGDGSVEVQVVSKGAAIPNLIFKPYSDTQGQYQGAAFLPPEGIGSSFYTVVKCLNWDNESAEEFDTLLESGIFPNSLVSEFAWELVFETYFYGFPVMRFISNPTVFQQMADSILAATDPANFDQPGYMPVTRTWSAGQRHMMESYVKYLDSGVGGGGKTNAKRLSLAFKRPKRKGLVEALSKPPGGARLGHG